MLWTDWCCTLFGYVFKSVGKCCIGKTHFSSLSSLLSGQVALPVDTVFVVNPMGSRVDLTELELQAVQFTARAMQVKLLYTPVSVMPFPDIRMILLFLSKREVNVKNVLGELCVTGVLDMFPGCPWGRSESC